MRDVAREAGVSPATVSRVLSGSRPVSPDVAAAVLTVSKRFGYRTNAIARALRARSTRTVGMVVPNIDNPFFPGVVKAAEIALHEAGHGLLLCDSRNDPTVEAERIDTLLDRQVDGLLISPCDRAASRTAVDAAAGQVPLVQVDRHVDVDTDVAGVDQGAGIEAVIDHLVRSGRSSFAFLTSGPSTSTAAERLVAYRRRVSAVRADGADRIYEGDFSVAWGHSATAKVLRGGTLPDALVCGNDLIALGALQRLREAGVDVPDGVAVTGFDDNGFAGICDPPLTTVRQPVDHLGGEAVRLLLSRIADPACSVRQLRLRPVLVERGSTRVGVPAEATL